MLIGNGRIRLSVRTVNRTYELSGIIRVTPFRKYENIWLGPELTDRESEPTACCSPVSPFLRFVVTEPSRMKSVRTEGCHEGLFREFDGQSNTTSEVVCYSGGWYCSYSGESLKFKTVFYWIELKVQLIRVIYLTPIGLSNDT